MSEYQETVLDVHQLNTGTSWGASSSGFIKSDDALCSNHVLQSYGELEKSLALLGETIEQLHGKLSPVLGPERAKPSESGQKNPVPSRSPLAEQLSNETARIRSFNYRLVELLNRLEV